MNYVLEGLQPPLRDHERQMAAASCERGNAEWVSTLIVTYGRAIDKAILRRLKTQGVQ